MDELPDEILLRIFICLKTKDLIQCSGVNRRWRRVSQDKTLWRTVDLSSCSVPLRTLGKLVKQHGVSALVLKQSTIEDPSCWANTFPPNELQTINLSNANISPRGIGHILKSTSRLVALDVSGCNISHIACKAVASSTQLRELNMNSSKLPAAGVKAIFDGCHALETVDVSNISNMNSQLRYIKCPTLRLLSVKECKLGFLEIQRLVQQCPNLKQLRLSIGNLFFS